MGKGCGGRLLGACGEQPGLNGYYHPYAGLAPGTGRPVYRNAATGGTAPRNPTRLAASRRCRMLLSITGALRDEVQSFITNRTATEPGQLRVYRS